MPSPSKTCFGNLLVGKIFHLVVLLFVNVPGRAVAEELCTAVTGEECPWRYVNFWLYTRLTTPHNPIKLEIHSLFFAPWVDGPIKILIHGYTGNKDEDINAELRKAYLHSGDCNVVSVDWGVLARKGCYLDAVRNMRPVARCVSDFMAGLGGYVTHVLGHDLGAHVAALASLETSPVRLTKFDPSYSLISSHDLVKGAAEVVDVYHTSAGVHGEMGPSGHMDVYLNSGVHQPGCGCNITCSHVRGLEYYAESIYRSMPIKAVPCDGWQSDAAGDCLVAKPSHFVDGGELIDTKMKGIFLAITRPQPPYLLREEFYDVIRNEGSSSTLKMLDPTTECPIVPLMKSHIGEFL